MTALEHVTQVQQQIDNGLGPHVEVWLVDPVTQERCAVVLEPRIGPEGLVFLALVPVVPGGR